MVDELSIIIPTLNEEHYLPKLLSSIATQDFQGRLQVIVVDGESYDKTITVAKKFKEIIRDLLIVQTTRGVSHQRNIGAQKAIYPHLLFLDADTVLPLSFLSHLTKRLEPNQSIFGLSIAFPLDGTIADYFFVLCEYLVILIASLYKPVVRGVCIITTKTNHTQIQGFNEGVSYAEDIDYGFRLRRNGAEYRFLFVPYLYESTS